MLGLGTRRVFPPGRVDYSLVEMVAGNRQRDRWGDRVRERWDVINLWRRGRSFDGPSHLVPEAHSCRTCTGA